MMATTKLVIQLDDLTYKVVCAEGDVALGEDFDISFRGDVDFEGCEVTVSLLSPCRCTVWSQTFDDLRYQNGVWSSSVSSKITTEEAICIVRARMQPLLLAISAVDAEDIETFYGETKVRVHDGVLEDGETITHYLTNLEQHNVDPESHADLRQTVEGNTLAAAKSAEAAAVSARVAAAETRKGAEYLVQTKALSENATQVEERVNSKADAVERMAEEVQTNVAGLEATVTTVEGLKKEAVTAKEGADAAATLAGQKATDAVSSADQAQTAKNEAEAAKEQAEEASKKAEEERASAQQFATNADNAAERAEAAYNRIGPVYKPKGSVPTYDDLPTKAEVGDVYDVLDTGMNYVWVADLKGTGAPGWDEFSRVVDLNAVTQAVSAAQTARDAAKGYRDEAESFKNAASSSASAAKTSETNAAQSVTAATEQAGIATGQAAAATTQASKAKTYRDEAEGFKSQAATCASNANTYCNQAQTANQNAQNAKAAAANSATAASTSASNAASSASNANASATAAAGSATTAASNAQNAEASAKRAEDAETNASTSASKAEQAKVGAEGASVWKVDARYNTADDSEYPLMKVAESDFLVQIAPKGLSNTICFCDGRRVFFVVYLYASVPKDLYIYDRSLTLVKHITLNTAIGLTCDGYTGATNLKHRMVSTVIDDIEYLFVHEEMYSFGNYWSIAKLDLTNGTFIKRVGYGTFFAQMAYDNGDGTTDKPRQIGGTVDGSGSGARITINDKTGHILLFQRAYIDTIDSEGTTTATRTSVIQYMLDQNLAYIDGSFLIRDDIASSLQLNILRIYNFRTLIAFVTTEELTHCLYSIDENDALVPVYGTSGSTATANIYSKGTTVNDGVSYTGTYALPTVNVALYSNTNFVIIIWSTPFFQHRFQLSNAGVLIDWNWQWSKSWQSISKGTTGTPTFDGTQSLMFTSSPDDTATTVHRYGFRSCFRVTKAAISLINPCAKGGAATETPPIYSQLAVANVGLFSQGQIIELNTNSRFVVSRCLYIDNAGFKCVVPKI